MPDRYLVNDHDILLPESLRGKVGVDSCGRRGIYFEPFTVLGLEALLLDQPQPTVFDAGCSYGILSCWMARRGARVHAFEAHPAVFSAARQIASLNNAHIDFVQACVGERSGGSVAFFAVPDAGSVASTRNPDICHFHKALDQVQAPLLALDDFPTVPSCIKLDVEGSEFQALLGARRLLTNHAPDLVIETHALEIDGIGGSLADLCLLLEDSGYPLYDLVRAEPVSGHVFARRHRFKIGHLLASRRLLHPSFAARIRRRWRQILIP